MTSEVFKYGLDRLTVQKALKLAREELKGIVPSEVREKVEENNKVVQEIAMGEDLVYSINTGFGSLCTTKISKEDTATLQKNLLMSHSAGVGDAIDKEISKLMLILKVQALCQGHSGISFRVIKRIMWHIDNDLVPVVPEQGSVGASGDLAPLAHLFLPLIGLGYIWRENKPVKSDDILNNHGKNPINLGAKEGLALINGTQFITAYAIKVSEVLSRCLDHADIIGAISLESYLGSPQPFSEELIKLRDHEGAVTTANRLRRLLENSGFVESHKDCGRVQDPYSMRCMPQVHGASRDALTHLNNILTKEINSVTDNPIIFNDGKAISGGNFHGQPMALPLDYVCLAASELGSISERRTYLLLEGKWGLPEFLIKSSGLNSGFMIAQYTSAALANENKSLCFPSSADTIPTSKGQEDHVSMGANSARKALNVVRNVEKILAIELLCAVQAFDFRRPLKSSEPIENCHEYVREIIPHMEKDTVLSEYINESLKIIRSKRLLEITGDDLK